MPASIYSDRYLPGKGDITARLCPMTVRGMPASMKGEVYDRLIEENDFGRFANSFLIIASKDGRQEKTIFAKYNRTRKQAFASAPLWGNWTESAGWEKAALESAGR